MFVIHNVFNQITTNFIRNKYRSETALEDEVSVELSK